MTLTKDDVGKPFTDDDGKTVWRLENYDDVPRVRFVDVSGRKDMIERSVEALCVRSMKRLVVEDK